MGRGIRSPSFCAAVIVAAMGLLAGCAVTPVNEPVGEKERSQILASILDSQWQDVARQYPDAFRPEVPVSHTVTDHDQPTLVRACLRANGIQATATDNGYRYSSSLGQSALEFAETTYLCTAAYPALSTVSTYLTGAEYDALYNYQLNLVRPCLLSIGAESPAPPAFGVTSRASGLSGWNPYDAVWQDNVSAGDLGLLEQRCPPVPGWLDLAN